MYVYLLDFLFNLFQYDYILHNVIFTSSYLPYYLLYISVYHKRVFICYINLGKKKNNLIIIFALWRKLNSKICNGGIYSWHFYFFILPNDCKEHLTHCCLFNLLLAFMYLSQMLMIAICFQCPLLGDLTCNLYLYCSCCCCCSLILALLHPHILFLYSFLYILVS